MTEFITDENAHALLMLTTRELPWGVYFGLFMASFVKFGIAAVAAMGNQSLNFLEILLTIGGGALLSVPFYTYFGSALRAWLQRIIPRRKSVSFARRRRIYKIWKRYGLTGVAFLSPIISPMIAVGVAVSFQETPRRIIAYVGTAVTTWAFIFAFLRRWVLMALDHLQGGML